MAEYESRQCFNDCSKHHARTLIYVEVTLLLGQATGYLMHCENCKGHYNMDKGLISTMLVGLLYGSS